MSNSDHENGLLLLLQAAKKLEKEELYQRSPYQNEKWEHKPSQRHSYDDDYGVYGFSNYGSQKRPVTTIRCTHNELEKSRRAHLRTCMETLKEHLNFDNDVPRITMLTVLKKAATTIQNLKRENHCLEICEDREKQKCAHLLKRRQALSKKIEERRNHLMKIQNWKERNRNSSECSVATTSSDDSEGDQRTGLQSRINAPLQFSSSHSTAAAGLNNNTNINNNNNNNTTNNNNGNDPNYMVHLSKHMMIRNSPNAGTVGISPVGLDAFDASSSDSGFEEITIASSGIVIPNEQPVVYCVDDAPIYENKLCRAF